jgi:hypothetical protein
MVSAFITKDGEKNPKSVHLLLSALRRPRAGLPDRSSWRGFPARRTVATCLVGGADLGDWLVRNGLALDWPEYSKRKYDDVQREAEQAGRGMWAGSYVEPWLYRVCIRASGSPANCSDDANAHPLEHAYRRPQLTLTLIMCTGGAYRPFLHDRHFST